MSERDESLVAVPRWALQFILENSFNEGMFCEGESEAVLALEDALSAVPLVPVYGSKPVE